MVVEEEVAVVAAKRGGVRALLALLTAFLAAIWMLAVSPAAYADGDPADDVIRSLYIDLTLEADGTMYVTETYEWDFGTRDGLGFFRTLIQQQGYDPDPDYVRFYRYSDFSVWSETGAPASVWVDQDTGRHLVLSVGAPDGSSDTRTGVQIYTLSYQVEGTLNAIRGQEGVHDQDELYWNVFSEWEVPIDEVTVAVVGPSRVTGQLCFQGRYEDDTPCASAVLQGDRAIFTGHYLAAGEAFTVAAAWPAGTFTNTAPILVENPARTGFWGVANATAPWLTAAFAALTAVLAGRRIVAGRDLIYAGYAPGTRNLRGAAPEVRLRDEPPVTVQFTPPAGIRPAQGGVIMTESVPPEALPGTLIDLAVRGFIGISVEGTSLTGKPNNWRIHQFPGPPLGPKAQLTGYEAALLRALFMGRNTVTTEELSGTFSEQVTDFENIITEDSDAHRWFQRPGLVSKVSSGVWAIPMVFGVVVLFLALDHFVMRSGIAEYLLQVARSSPWLFALGAMVVGVLPFAIGVTAKAAHGRTGEGRAAYDQLRGFKEYISTADAEQLRWEEGQDIFSEYLPWAIMFGESERWGRLFEQLAAQGRYNVQPTWYRGYGYGYGYGISYSGIADSVSGFSSEGASALSAAPSTGGSSGLSGFGGGGFAGGGGGGGGGGGR